MSSGVFDQADVSCERGHVTGRKFLSLKRILKEFSTSSKACDIAFSFSTWPARLRSRRLVDQRPRSIRRSPGRTEQPGQARNETWNSESLVPTRTRGRANNLTARQESRLARAACG